MVRARILQDYNENGFHYLHVVYKWNSPMHGNIDFIEYRKYANDPKIYKQTHGLDVKEELQLKEFLMEA